jgi:hypothetical protein
MNSEIELYRGPDYVLFGRMPLGGVLRLGLERILGRPLEAPRILLLVRNVPDEAGAAGEPSVSYLFPDYGYATVQVEEHGRLVYRHPHPIDELVTRPLRELLRDTYPEETHWAFCLVGDGLPRPSVVRPEPPVRGVVEVTPYREGEAPPFRIRRVPEEPLPEAALADFGVTFAGTDGAAFAKVLVPRPLHHDLTAARPLSDQVEEGGFLIGRAYRDRDAAGTYLLEVTAALPAEHTGASLLHFTFTGDSFEAVKRALREAHPGKRLLGWYHTHLFAATEEMGLSSIDLRLHFTTFRQPWQLAGLVNLDGDRRTLRFYVRQQDTMALCPQWVTDERP